MSKEFCLVDTYETHHLLKVLHCLWQQRRNQQWPIFQHHQKWAFSEYPNPPDPNRICRQHNFQQRDSVQWEQSLTLNWKQNSSAASGNSESLNKEICLEHCSLQYKNFWVGSDSRCSLCSCADNLVSDNTADKWNLVKESYCLHTEQEDGKQQL